jgi:hypothetical protein
MKRERRLARLWPGLLPLCVAFATTAAAADPFAEDGWYTWRVAAVQPNPVWCCFDWNANQGQPRKHESGVCDLDSRNNGFTSSDQQGAGSADIQVYARLEQGKVHDLRPLSPACEVRSRSAVVNLGHVEVAQSLAWLQQDHLSSKVDDDQRLLTIATHAGPEAGDILWQAARKNPDLETRKSAVFWMAQLRIEESSGRLQELINSEPNAGLRDHAVFAYAQSDAPDRTEVLIGIIENRELELSDRRNALFWLAESGSTEGIDYIQNLLTGVN